MLWLPLVIVEVYIFGLGLSFFLSALFVKFRDIQYIWDLLTQAGFYLTPILYPLTRIESPIFQKIIFMNPMAQAIQDARYVLVSHDQSIKTIWSVFNSNWQALIPIGVVLFVFVTGVSYFRSQQNSFAENL